MTRYRVLFTLLVMVLVIEGFAVSAYPHVAREYAFLALIPALLVVALVLDRKWHGRHAP